MRIRALRFVGPLLALVPFLLVAPDVSRAGPLFLVPRAPVDAAQATWPQTYHDAGHSGFNPSETTLSISNVSGLKRRWAKNVPGGVTGFVLDGGTVFAQGQGGSQGANLLALNASTGARVWSIVTGSDGISLNGTLAVANGRVFAGCAVGFSNQKAGICAYEATTGKRLWSYYYDCNCAPPSGPDSQLVYDGGLVYFGFHTGNGGNAFVAVNAVSGQAVWSYGGFDNSHGIGTLPAALGGGNVYITRGGSPNPGSGILAFNAATGSAVWTITPFTNDNPALTAAGGVLYAHSETDGSFNTVEAFKETTGASLWSFMYPNGSYNPQPVAVAKGVVYVTGTDGNLYALHATSGKLIWSGLGGGDSGVTSSPSIANGVLYADHGGISTGTSPQVTAYNAATGALLWSSPKPQSTINPPPIVANGILYFANLAGVCEVCAYSLPAANTQGLQVRRLR